MSRFPTLFLSLFVFAASVRAQEPFVMLNGVVTGPDGRPLSGALVIAAGAARTALTDRGGRFVVNGLRPGTLSVEVQHLGYRTSGAALLLQSGVVAHWDVQLHREPLRLPEVLVVAVRAPTPQIEAFFERRARGAGQFFTRADIEAMQARQFTDILRRVPGARLLPITGPFGTVHVMQLGRAPGNASSQPCPIVYYVNGVPFPVRLDVGIDAFLRADDVHAVEVYSGTARIPPQFLSSANPVRCGVVAVWTRAGSGTAGFGPR